MLQLTDEGIELALEIIKNLKYKKKNIFTHKPRAQTNFLGSHRVNQRLIYLKKVKVKGQSKREHCFD